MSSEDIKVMSGAMADAVIIPDEPTVYTDKLQIHVNGRKYKTQFTKKFIERKIWKEPNPNEIVSILPGSVNAVLVKKGAKVKKGDKLLIYEAMKMKNVISAPFDGEVEMVNVEPGDKLPKGALLILLKQEKPAEKKKRTRR